MSHWHTPNTEARIGCDQPSMVVLHYTGMETAEAALARLCDPVAKVSAHWVIDVDGTVHQLADESLRCWHAGVSCWGGVTDNNSRSIGIEIVNPGHWLGYHPFPAVQMAAVQRVLTAALARWQIDPALVVGHADIAPTRKIDPGEKFDWRALARRDLSIWLDHPAAEGPILSQDASARADFAAAARAFGYHLPDPADHTLFDAVLRAFRSRFRPHSYGQPLTRAAIDHMTKLAMRWPVANPLNR